MASVTKSETYPIPVENFYRIITDYESYPQFMDGVESTSIIEATPEGALVEYSLNLIKSFAYRLRLTHHAPHRVSWVLDSGELFKKNEGLWEFKDLGAGRTQVTYSLETQFKLMVPQMIINKLIKTSLPKLFEDLQKRAQNL